MTRHGDVSSLLELAEKQATRLDRKVLYHYLANGDAWTFADLPVRAARVAPVASVR